MLQTADLTIRLNAADDVVIARTELPQGTEVLKEKYGLQASYLLAIRSQRERSTLAILLGDITRLLGSWFNL